MYESKYNICNHFDSKNPLASIGFNESEKYMDDYLYDGWLKTYIYRDLGTILHISFLEFINQPRYVIEKQIAIAIEISNKKNQANKSFLDDIQKDKVNIADNLKGI